MSVISYSRGHEIKHEDGIWRYADTGEIYMPDDSRPCIKCGQEPTPEGYDACIGQVDGATSICCGHGVHAPIEVIR